MRLIGLILATTTLVCAAESMWERLPDLPDKEGFAGAFAGVSNGALIVAGGTNFPDKRPWDGGTKVWYDTVYSLEKPDGEWRVVGKLPKPNGYGVSITTEEGLLVIGGGNATEHFRDVHWIGKATRMPPLPKPCAFMGGCVLDGVVYVVGGIEKPVDTTALNTFWSLDLKKPGAKWQELAPCPGKPRILSCMAAVDGAVFVFSGSALMADAEGKPVRDWLQDAWRYELGSGWKKLPDLPRVSVAAPSPAPVVESQILILGGDDGKMADFEPKTKHPGFPRSILAFDLKTQTWSETGEVAFSLVTTNAVLWDGQIVIPGGEARPGVRSPQVWRGTIER